MRSPARGIPLFDPTWASLFLLFSLVGELEPVFIWGRGEFEFMSASSISPRHRHSSDNEGGGQQISRSARSPLRMGHLQQLRSMLDELAVKLDARDCLERNNRHRYAARIQVEVEFMRFLDSMQDLVTSHVAPSTGNTGVEEAVAGKVSESASDYEAATSSDAVRIQLKLTPALVRVLQAVRQENVKASQLVEEVLWESRRVQDTAELAGIQRPVQLPAA